MSLAPESRGRGRSKSPGRRERSRSNVRAPSPGPVYASAAQYQQYATNTALQYQDDPPAPVVPLPMPGDQSRYAQPPQYQHREAAAPNYASPTSYMQRTPSNDTRGQYNPQSPGYANPTQYAYNDTPTSPQSRSLNLAAHGSINVNMGGSHSPGAQYAQPSMPQYAQPTQNQYANPSSQYTTAAGHHNSFSTPSAARPQYASESSYQYQYATPDERIKYNYKEDVVQPPQNPYAHGGPQLIEAHPGHHHAGSQGLLPSMQHLSIGGGPLMPGGYGPPSPLLEPYHGTYQSISPMPGAMHLSSEGLDELSPLTSESESDSETDSDDSERIARKHAHPGKKRVKFWKPEKDARKLAAALKDKGDVDADVLIDILPKLTSEQILELRAEYKKIVKSKGQGINISKQIKTFLNPGSFNKACYAVALGRWESEAYWANFWYQGGGSKNELLIEALMGRSNEEIRAIKDAFSDKRYGDSLEKCMKSELKANKFRHCILLALEENRQPEAEPLYANEVRGDVETLHKAIRAKEGGETTMINIIVRRSDKHLREVMRVYEQNFGENFTRAMLAKSNNLVVSYRIPSFPFPLCHC